MSQSNLRKTVLFVTYGGGHVSMVIPVVKALEHSGLDIQVLGLTMAGPALKRAGIPYLTFQDFLLESDDEAIKYGHELAEGMHAQHTDIPHSESVAYLGLSKWDLYSRLGAQEADTQLATQGRAAFVPTTILERVFDKLKPDIVVTTTSPRAELAARLVAEKRGILSLCISDLIGSVSHPISVTDLCVGSYLAAEKYKSIANVKFKKIHVTGNPAMDRAISARGLPSKSWRAENFPKLDPNRKFVLSTEQQGFYSSETKKFVFWKPDQIPAHLEATYQACQLNNAVMLIRPHPSLAPEIYSNWMESKPPTEVAYAAKHDLYPLLNACDVVISNNSTIMLDALYSDRPVVLVTYPESISLLPLDKMKMAYGCNIDDTTEYEHVIRQALSDKIQNGLYLEEFNKEFPKLPCAPRIADIILASVRQ